MSGTDAAPLLVVSNLHHVYGNDAATPAAIDDVSFDVHRGEFLAVVGPSGSGKTTLLRCLSGLIAPTSGTITLNDRPVSDVPEELAVVFQDYSRSLFPWLTVRANVAMPLRRLRLAAAENEERVATALAEVGLADGAARYPWQLSGGMQQRVAIARAFAVKPSLLLMDEPFASVDAQTRADLQDLILEVWRRHDSTVVFVTHDIDESVYLADRVAVLSLPPTTIAREIEIDLERPRDQIATRETRQFAELRAEVARLIMNAPTGQKAPTG